MCQLSKFKLTHENIFNLTAAIAEYYKLKSVHDLWTHPINLQHTNHTCDLNQSFKKIQEHTQDKRPFNEILKQYLSDFCIALALNENNIQPEHEQALPTLIQFVKGTLSKSIKQNDPTLIFWLTHDPLRLMNHTQRVRQEIVAELNRLSAKKESNINDQLPNMSYASKI
jgi:hypothetical protein